ncbi:glycosyltransferase [Clostridium perfringens]
MNLGIFVPNVGNFGAKGYYNSQEVGLAKELARKFENVIIFKLVIGKNKICEEIIKANCKIIYIPAKKIGINGLIKNFDFIRNYKLNKLVCFSDTQIIVKSLYEYCNNNNIMFIPYIGVIESNSSNKLVRKVMNVIIKRNINIYKRCNFVMAKTPHIYKKLKRLGLKNIKISPVGLDFELLNDNYTDTDVSKVKLQFGFNSTDKIILFIGRLEKQKNPILAVDILKEVLTYDKNYHMIIIGKGNLKEELIKKINDENLKDNIKYIEQISNNEIWKYYSISECFINLNMEEIFGMAILESMFYNCPVIAVSAPGPNYIIKDKETGILINKLDINNFAFNIVNSKQILDKIRMNSKLYIKENFSWIKCANNILNGGSNGKEKYFS